MKNETARREIESLDYYLQNHTDDYSEESHTAMMMAIKALEQEPCEDAISRQAVCEIINNIRDCISVEGYWAILERLKKLPPVNPTKTGRWIFCEGIKGKDNVEKCSCCQSHWKEAIIYRKDTQEYLRTRLLYCPNCGARMIDPQESEE